MDALRIPVKYYKGRLTQELDSATDGERPLERAKVDQTASHKRSRGGDECASHVNDCVRNGGCKLEYAMTRPNQLHTAEQPRTRFRWHHRGQERSLRKVCLSAAVRHQASSEAPELTRILASMEESEVRAMYKLIAAGRVGANANPQVISCAGTDHFGGQYGSHLLFYRPLKGYQETDSL
jgi:hypothetical protein